MQVAIIESDFYKESLKLLKDLLTHKK